MCSFRQSTENHIHKAPIYNNSFVCSFITARYGPQYVASSGPMTAPSRMSHIYVGRLLDPHILHFFRLPGWLDCVGNGHLGWSGLWCMWRWLQLAGQHQIIYNTWPQVLRHLPPPLSPHVGPTGPRGGAPASRLHCTWHIALPSVPGGSALPCNWTGGGRQLSACA